MTSRWRAARILTAALLLGLFAGSLQRANPVAAATLVVDDDLACPGAAFSTIAAAITAASNGDTIQVCAGSYTENLTVNKALTITGVDPGAVPNPQNLLTPGTLSTVISAASAADPIFDVTADFTSLHIANIRAIGHTGGGVLRLAIAGVSSDFSVDKVAFDGGARQIFSTGPARIDGVSVTNSAFRCSSATASGLELWTTQSDLTVTHNYITACRDGMNLSNVGGVTAPVTGPSLVGGNRIESVGDSGIQVAIAFEDLTISENVILDADMEAGLGEGIQIGTGAEASQITILNNRIQNGDHGLVFESIAGSSAQISASGNLITGNAVGVIVRAGVTSANLANLHVNENCIESNTTGASNTIATTLDAEDNWWGDASGPFNAADNPGGAGNPVGSNVDFQPFLTEPAACGPLAERGLVCGIQAAAEPAGYSFDSPPDLVEIEVIDDGSELDCLRVTLVPGDHPNAEAPQMTGRYWTIEALQSDKLSPATADYEVALTLPHATADAADQVCRYTGSGWDCAATGFVANASVSRSGIAELSDWAIGDQALPDAPTAATLVHYTLTVDAGGRVTLSWETASELDVLGFQVERARGSGPWAAIGPLVPARGGAATGAQYRWHDSPGTGTHRYRLAALSGTGPPQVFGLREARIDRIRAFLPIAKR